MRLPAALSAESYADATAYAAASDAHSRSLSAAAARDPSATASVRADRKPAPTGPRELPDAAIGSDDSVAATSARSSA